MNVDPLAPSSVVLWEPTSESTFHESTARYQLLLECVQEIVFQVGAAVRRTFLNSA